MTEKIYDFFCRPRRHASLWHMAIILILGTVAYANTFGAQFNFDDISAILGNPVVRSTDLLADPLVVKGMRAVGDLTFALNYKLGMLLQGNGFAVQGYHYVNLIIHLINALLVYLLVFLTLASPVFPADETGRKWSVAFLAALLFVAHPLQTQAVTYIVQRYTSLATLFYLASLLSYVGARRLWGKGGKKAVAAFCVAVSIIAAILAMRTKEITFTLPFMVLLYEFFFFRGKLRKRMLLVVACLAAAAVVPISLIAVTGGRIWSRIDALTRVQTDMPRADYLFTQFRVIVGYLRLLFFPAGQNLDHDVPVYHSFFQLPVAVSFLLLAAIFACGVYCACLSRNPGPELTGAGGEVNYASHPSPFTVFYRLIAFGIFWFFLALSVESSVIPIVDVMFEHRVYLPSVGFFIAVAALVVLAMERLSMGSKKAAGAVLVVALLIPAVLAAITFNRNRVWTDEMTLWQDVVAKSPDKSRAWNNLAYAYLKQRQPKKAIPALITSINLSPGHPDAWNNIGMALTQLGTYAGRYSPTYELFDISSGINSVYQSEWFALAYNNLGLAYDSLGENAQAMDSFRKSIDMNPRLAEARFNLALACTAAGDRAGLAEQYNVLKTLNPQLAEKLRITTGGAR
ncbi:tetratricopeptide repeat protein [Geotalea sp. SG265]|uniref:tetratricopeptide repeat protein n=1 Tax=Geotalea sp. SG265 TaxID=2922867 RepID=UPI001FAFD86E|nr:tetratricopeptide repeat protein [Geotalea sp. SG265]